MTAYCISCNKEVEIVSTGEETAVDTEGWRHELVHLDLTRGETWEN